MTVRDRNGLSSVARQPREQEAQDEEGYKSRHSFQMSLCMNQSLVRVETISMHCRTTAECGPVSNAWLTGFCRVMERDDAGDPTPDGRDKTTDHEHSGNGVLHRGDCNGFRLSKPFWICGSRFVWRNVDGRNLLVGNAND
jgi:hypothetical protein